jgi:hypothetical protein
MRSFLIMESCGSGPVDHRRFTVTPSLNGESCSSIFTGLSFFGMSNASRPCTVLPGLIELNQVLELPAPDRSMSAAEDASYLRSFAS